MKTKKKLPVPIDSSKRHFLNLTVTAMSGISAAAFAWPFIDSMNPSSDQAAFADVEVEFLERDRLTPKRGTMSIKKAQQLLGYSPQNPIEIGFPKYINWYKEMREN